MKTRYFVYHNVSGGCVLVRNNNTAPANAKLQFFIAQSIFWIFKIIPGLNVLLIELLSSRNKSVKNTVASLGIIS